VYDKLLNPRQSFRILYFKTTCMGIKRFCVRLRVVSDLCVGTVLNRSLKVAPSTFFVRICLVPRLVFYLWHCAAHGSWPVCFIYVLAVCRRCTVTTQPSVSEYCSWQENEYGDIHIWKGCKRTYCVVMKRIETRKYTVMSGQGIVITLTRYFDEPTGTMVS